MYPQIYASYRYLKLSVLSIFLFQALFMVFCSNALAAQVTLAWDSNTEPDLAGYRLHYGTSSRIYPFSIDVENSTVCTVSDLAEGRTYYFAVTAYNTHGDESAFSIELRKHFPQETPPPDGEMPQFETGELIIDHNWTRIEFHQAFSDPVIVAKPLSLNGGQPAFVRIRNVDQSSFEIRVQEWEYQDGFHVAESVSYLAMEEGSYILKDGTRIEAGTFETSKTSAYENVTFAQPFQRVPVVVASISSFSGADGVIGRMRDITVRDFKFRMQEQELSSQIHYPETISYIAWEPSSGNIGGDTFEINRTANVVTHNFHRILFNRSFAAGPIFLADMQTTNGINTANVRWQNKNTDGVQVQIAEEQSADSETNHIAEVVGYMVFSK